MLAGNILNHNQMEKVHQHDHPLIRSTVQMMDRVESLFAEAGVIERKDWMNCKCKGCEVYRKELLNKQKPE